MGNEVQYQLKSEPTFLIIMGAWSLRLCRATDVAAHFTREITFDKTEFCICWHLAPKKSKQPQKPSSQLLQPHRISDGPGEFMVLPALNRSAPSTQSHSLHYQSHSA